MSKLPIIKATLLINSEGNKITYTDNDGRLRIRSNPRQRHLREETEEGEAKGTPMEIIKKFNERKKEKK
ncbi:MAG: hypothetical protein J6B34_04705 [Clostridia bacterium]|nr:hypothetical protein [Clostridia bacterium]